MNTATAESGIDQEPLPAVANQPQEPKLTPSGSVLPDDYYEARVNLTIAIPHRGPYPGFGDAYEDVLAALQQQKPLPDGSFVRGGINISTRTAKEIRGDTKRADAKKARRFA